MGAVVPTGRISALEGVQVVLCPPGSPAACRVVSAFLRELILLQRFMILVIGFSTRLGFGPAPMRIGRPIVHMING